MRSFEVCAGIGGLTLGLEMAGFECAGLCEIDDRCRAHLQEKWPDVPVYRDMRALSDHDLRSLGRVDLLAGGIPCQPWSVAGKQAGPTDERDLWPDFLSLAQRLGAAAILVENVSGISADIDGLDRIAGDLERSGYCWWACSIRAADVGAPHLRDRIFICAVRMGHSEGVGSSAGPREQGIRYGKDQFERSGACGVGDSERPTLRGNHGELRGSKPEVAGNWHSSAGRQTVSTNPWSEPLGDADQIGRWARPAGSAAAMRRQSADSGHQGDSRWSDAIPILCRDGKYRLIPPQPELFPVAHGAPGRVARLRALGNAVVPLQAYVPARALYEELAA